MVYTDKTLDQFKNAGDVSTEIPITIIMVESFKQGFTGVQTHDITSAHYKFYTDGSNFVQTF